MEPDTKGAGGDSAGDPTGGADSAAGMGAVVDGGLIDDGPIDDGADPDGSGVEGLGENVEARGFVQSFDLTVQETRGDRVSLGRTGAACIVEESQAGSDRWLTVRLVEPAGKEGWVRAVPLFDVFGVLQHDQGCLLYGGFSGALQVDDDTNIASVVNPQAVVGSSSERSRSSQSGRSSQDGVAWFLGADSKTDWVQVLSGFGNDLVRAASFTAGGDVVVAGDFVADLQVGEHRIQSVDGSAESRVFLAQLGPSGEPRALRQLDQGTVRAVAASPLSGGPVVIQGRADEENFLWRLSDLDAEAIELRWPWQAGEAGEAELDAEGNTYLGLSGARDGGPLLGQELTGRVALAKLDATLEPLWVTSFFAEAFYVSVALAPDTVALSVGPAEGSPVNLGAGTFDGFGRGDALFAEFSLDGDPEYAVLLGSSEWDYAGEVVATESGFLWHVSWGASVNLAEDTPSLPAGDHLLWLDRVALR